MSLFGKILAVLNVLAAGAFVYLATMDWGKRQAWSYAAFRHDLALDGLPLDENDKAWVAKFQMTPAEIGDFTIKEIAKTTGGDKLGVKPGDRIKSKEIGKDVFIRSLDAEVERTRDKVFDYINAADGPEAKRRRVLDFLLPQLDSGTERDRISDANLTKTEDAEQELRSRFERALDPKDRDGKDRDPAERRRSITHLLYYLDPSPDWHNRVMTLVGLENYGPVVDTQAANLQAMVVREKDLLVADQAAFEGQYNALVQQAVFLNGRIDTLQRELDGQTKIKTDKETLVQARQSDVEALTTELANAKAALAKLLKRQAELENQVHAEQNRLGSAQERNVQLERMLRKIEIPSSKP
jgi:hypothetical protein